MYLDIDTPKPVPASLYCNVSADRKRRRILKEKLLQVVDILDNGEPYYTAIKFLENNVRETSLIIEVAQLEINLLEQKVFREGVEIRLQPKELSILALLARNKGRVFSRTEILEHVWGHTFDHNSNIVEKMISCLRKKLEPGFRVPLLHTVKNEGYVFDDSIGMSVYG